MSKEKIEELTKRLELIKQRRTESKEQRQLEKQVAKEEKKLIKEERFRLKHPKLYRAKQVAKVSVKAGAKGFGYSIARLFETYRRGKSYQRQQYKQRKKLRM